MANLQNMGSTFSEPAVNINSPVQGSGINVGRTNQSLGLRHPAQLPTLTSNPAVAWRQQMDESNHEMVQMLTQTLTTVLNPLIQNTTQSNQQMTAQVARMSEFLGIPQHQRPLPRDWVRENQEPTFEEDLTINQIPQNQGGVVVPSRIEPHVPKEPRMLIVNRNQNVDDIIRQVRHDEVAADNNLEAIVERIMVRNGVNFGLRRPNYTSPLAEYILQAEVPLRTKIPKFTKFAGDTTEFTVEHVARYLIEAGDMSNNESLQKNFFPSSLTKNAFTWFITLPQISIYSWNQLEKMFHEQFYMGQTKISLKELANVRRKFTEPIDDYLNRFRILKAMYFTQVPEHELIEMAVGGLNYSIRKKLDTQ